MCIRDRYSPFGMALVGNNFYVANADAVVRFRYTPGATAISSAGSRLVTLPGGKLNHHWTKSLIANRSGTKLYSGVGSNSNAAENGICLLYTSPSPRDRQKSRMPS